MRIAALYDVHGNLPALEAVLADVEGVSVDLVLVGGDVAWGPFPGETLERLRAPDDRVRFIRGNADREVAGEDPSEEYRELTLWCHEQLTEEQRSFLASLPEQTVIDVDGFGRVRFCHGSPRSDEESITRLTPDARLGEMLAGVEEPVVVCGHTHMQFDRRLERHRIVNPGSVGMPYGERAACWALLGAGLQLVRTLYDLEAAAARIRLSGYPDAESFAAGCMRPPTEAEALAALEGRD